MIRISGKYFGTEKCICISYYYPSIGAAYQRISIRFGCAAEDFASLYDAV